MPSPAKGAAGAEGAAARVHLLDRLRGRLEDADALTRQMQQGLKRADRSSIEEATSRLETLALEIKVLAAEYGRLPADLPGDRNHERARKDLQKTATRLARSAAIGGGLLERLVDLTGRITGTLQAARGETYLPSGKTAEPQGRGLRLREQA